MAPKQRSGIKRGAKSGGTTKSGGAAKNADIVFQTRLETDEEYRKRKGKGLYYHTSPEALNALNALPEGAEFTVQYSGFGSYGQTRYVIGIHGMRDRTVSRVDENGRYNRYRMAKTKSQLRDIIDMRNAYTITIHNGGKSMRKQRLREILAARK